MTSLKCTDRIAVAAMFAVSVAIPVAASLTPSTAHAIAKPSLTITLEDGTQRSFVTSGPFGTTTFRTDTSADGKVLGTAQVLEGAMFQTIHDGMLASDVLAKIGPPNGKVRFTRTNTTAWQYHFQDPWNYDSDFSVIVNDAGVVVGKFTARNGE